MGDAGIMRAYVLALLVAVVGVQCSYASGLVEVPVRPFRWAANMVGGLLFGVGMILSGGCSGSTWYRVGEGAIGAWVILLGFAMGATTASVGALAPPARVAAGDRVPCGRRRPHPPLAARPPALARHRRPRRRGRRVARARPARGRAREVALAAHRRGGGRPDRRGLVDVHARRPPGRHHVRREHRPHADVSAGGLSQPGDVEHGAAGRRAGGRACRRAWPRRFPLEAAARLEPGEDLRRAGS